MPVTVGEPSVLRGTAVGDRAPTGLVGLISWWVRQTPDAPACRDAEGSWSYADLDRHADALAAALRAARPESSAPPAPPVVVAVRRGRALSAALLAVLRAGHAYLPVTEDTPRDRLRRMAQISGATHAFVDDVTMELCRSAGLRTIDVAAACARGEDDPPTRHLAYDMVSARQDRPAYVMFTSGSSGDPKGVQLGTAALCNRLIWMRDTYAVDARDRILQKTPISFDVSGWELWLPLISGAECVHLPPGEHVEPQRIDAVLRETGITLVHFVPSMLQEFLSWPRGAPLPRLRAIFCSGEALTPALVARTKTEFASTALHNLYGPTEAAIDVTAWECPADADDVPIGAPVDGCVLAVTDADGHVLPQGLDGELCIGGLPLADGYVGRPDLDAAAFVPAPEEVGVGRMYRTGDRAVIRDGVVRYLGRLDDQLKIRGQRVEPGEVAACLESDPAVAQAVVVGYTTASGTTSLAAFVRARGDATPSKERLRDLAAARLPEAWVPTHIQLMASFPLSGSGKLDRKALAALAAERPESAGPSNVPGDAPAWLAEVWAQVTDGNVEMRFLQSGATSLGAARLSAAVATHGGRSMAARWFLSENPDLTTVVDQLGLAPALGVGVADERRTDPDSAFPVAPNQRRLWLLSKLHPDDARYNVVEAVLVDAHLDVPTLRSALSEVMAQHVLLRSSLQDDAGELLAVPQACAPPVIEHPGVRAHAEAAVAQHATVVLPIDRAPLFAVHVDRVGEDQTLLTAVLHHAVADQESVAALFEQLGAAYAGHTVRRPVADYSRYAAFARERERRDGATALSNWRARLSDAPVGTLMPYGRSDERSASAAVGGGMPAAATARLREYAAGRGVTPAVVVLTAFATAAASWLGEPDVVVGVASSADRQLAVAAEEIGFFVDTVPVRVDARHEVSADALVCRTSDSLAAGSALNAAAFDAVAHAVDPAAPVGRDAVFQLWFNDLSQRSPGTHFAAHPCRAVAREKHPALFDIALYVEHVRPSLELTLVFTPDRYDDVIAQALLRQTIRFLVALTADAGVGALDAVAMPVQDRRPEVAPVPPAVRDAVAVSPGMWSADGSAGSVLDPHGREWTGKDLARTFDRFRRLLADARPTLLKARPDARLGVVVAAAWSSRAPLVILDAEQPRARLAAVAAATGTVRTIDLTGGAGRHPSGSAAGRLPSREGDRAGHDVGHCFITSGTTGEPKVVRLPHDAALAPLRWLADTMSHTAQDVFCLLAGPGHDPMLRQAVLPLLLGARLVIPAAAVRGEVFALLDFLREQSVTVLDLTPAKAELLIAAADSATDRVATTLPDLRVVTSYGALLSVGVANGLARLAPGAEIWNLYGTTETPQASSARRWTRGPLDAGRGQAFDEGLGVPIGTGTPYRRLTVRTAAGRSTDVGQLGEIVVSGAGLALPDGDVPGALPPTGPDEVRTGDRGRWNPYGEIEIAGRLDRQLSVLGHRVEPAEIEAVLRGHRDVVTAAVAQLDEALIAWVVPEQTGTAGSDLVAQCRSRIRAALPAWCMPDRVLLAAAVPLTANGKPDVAALAASLRADGADGPASAAPQVPATGERAAEAATLAELQRLCELVHGSAIPVDVSFFEGGLTSLDLVRLHSAIRKDMAVDIAIVDLFRHARLDALAHAISTQRDQQHARPDARRPAPADASRTSRHEDRAGTSNAPRTESHAR